MGFVDYNFMGSTHLKWLAEMLTFFKADTISIPQTYRDRVIKIKEILENDNSGLVNSLLDFAIKCALVDYKVETNNNNLTILFNNWLSDINSSLRGIIPTGINSLAKEYFRELWKGSSFLLLRTLWENVDGMYLPTKLWFLDGEDIEVEDGKGNTKVLGDEKYFLRIDENNNKPLPAEKNEIIFVQKPFSSWGELDVKPFLLIRGIYENLKMMDLMLNRSQRMVDKALEYVLLLKKGSESLAREKNPDFTYSKDDLISIKEDFKNFLKNRKTTAGTSTYITQWDTEIEHIIPEYRRILEQEIYSPIERRILAGLGLVEILEGTTTTRREAVLNPKPFMSLVEQGVDDFKQLLTDILETIKEKNKRRRKYWGKIIRIYNDPIKQFITNDIKVLLRSVYDRGNLSKKTFTEVVAERDFDIEVERRKKEANEGIDVTMFPHPIQNLEAQVSPLEERQLEKIGEPDNEDLDLEDQDKTGPEKKNYLQALEEAECPKCKEVFDFESQEEIEVGVVKCPECGSKVYRAKLIEEAFKPEVTENYIRIRQKDPNDFQSDRFRVITLSKPKGIKAIIGRLKGKTTTTIQSFLFDKKKWNTKKAQNWIKEHKRIVEGIFEEAPYTKKHYLPQIKNLPSGARSIWINTFNAVFRQTKDEDQARQSAWAQVKRVYHKVNDKWIKKTKGEIEKSLQKLNIDE